MEKKTIEAVARELNVSKSTLRYYDQIGLVKPEREKNRYRMYTNEEIRRIKYVLVMKHAGFKIEEMQLLINTMIQKPTETCVAETNQLLREKRLDFQQKLAFFQEMLSLLDGLPDLAVMDEKEELEVDGYIDRLFQSLRERGEWS